MTLPSTVILAPADWQELRRAREYLEHPSLASRIAALLGLPIERGMRLLPPVWDENLRRALTGGVERALALAIAMAPFDRAPAGRGLHALLGATTGAVAGLFGLPALLIELPISTAIVLHGIAAVARAEGEDLSSAEARAECVKVFALGGRASEDDAAETGYYGLRVSLAWHFAPRGGGPASLQLVRAVASRFGATVSDKAAAQMVPVAGAACASLVNLAFVRHFQDVAIGHFTIRRLERTYGADLVKEAYDRMAAAGPQRTAADSA